MLPMQRVTTNNQYFTHETNPAGVRQGFFMVRKPRE